MALGSWFDCIVVWLYKIWVEFNVRWKIYKYEKILNYNVEGVFLFAGGVVISAPIGAEISFEGWKISPLSGRNEKAMVDVVYWVCVRL